MELFKSWFPMISGENQDNAESFRNSTAVFGCNHFLGQVLVCTIAAESSTGLSGRVDRHTFCLIYSSLDYLGHFESSVNVVRD